MAEDRQQVGIELVNENDQHLRIVEALLFASAEPLSVLELQHHLPEGIDPAPLLDHLRQHYATRGVNLVQAANGWAFRTAADLGHILQREITQPRKLSRAALEVLAIIAYHQPVTRAEIEEVRGVETSKGTLDLLLESGWVRMRGRRRTPGRPVTYGTTAAFLDQFGLLDLGDLPGLEELKGAGFLSPDMPANFSMPAPGTIGRDAFDEDELSEQDLEDLGLFPPSGAQE